MMVEQQRAKIEELELGQSAQNVRAMKEEVDMLRAIIEAQEEALNDQKGIIGNQSTLIDDLSAAMNAQRSSTPPAVLEDVEEIDSPSGAGDQCMLTGSSMSTGVPAHNLTGSSSTSSGVPAHHQAASGGPRVRGPPPLGGGSGGMGRDRPSGERPSGDRPSASNTGADPPAQQRRRPREGAAPPSAPGARGPGPGTQMPGGSQSNQGGPDARSRHREQLLAQKLLNRVGTTSPASAEHPQMRAPRPNPEMARGATTRARSLTDRGSSGGSVHSARGPSPNRSPEKEQGYTPSASMGGTPSRKLGGPHGPLPPALPLLRQEA